MAERSPLDYGDRVGRLEGIIEQINDRLGSLELRLGSVKSSLEADISSVTSPPQPLWISSISRSGQCTWQQRGVALSAMCRTYNVEMCRFVLPIYLIFTLHYLTVSTFFVHQ